MGRYLEDYCISGRRVVTYSVGTYSVGAYSVGAYCVGACLLLEYTNTNINYPGIVYRPPAAVYGFT